MKPDQAAKVLRAHNAWRRGADGNHWQQSPYSPAELGHAIDAAVAALERETYMRDVEVKRRDNHISDCACDTCTRVMRYEDALHEQSQAKTNNDDQRCGACNDIHDTFTPCNNDHEDDAA